LSTDSTVVARQDLPGTDVKQDSGWSILPNGVVVIEEKFNVVVVLLNKSAKNAVQVVLPSSTGLARQSTATSAWITQSGSHILTLTMALIHLTCLSGSE